MTINLNGRQRLMLGLLLNEYIDPDVKRARLISGRCQSLATDHLERASLSYTEDPAIKFQLEATDEPLEFDISTAQAEVLKAVIDRYPKRRRDLAWCEPLLAQL